MKVLSFLLVLISLVSVNVYGIVYEEARPFKIAQMSPLNGTLDFQNLSHATLTMAMMDHHYSLSEITVDLFFFQYMYELPQDRTVTLKIDSIETTKDGSTIYNASLYIDETYEGYNLTLIDNATSMLPFPVDYSWRADLRYGIGCGTGISTVELFGNPEHLNTIE